MRFLLLLLLALPGQAQWNVAFIGDLATPPQAAAGGSYDYEESFEAPGYTLSWTEVGDTASLDDQYTTTILEGSYSFHKAAGTGAGYAHFSITPGDTYSAHFRIQTHTAAASITTMLFGFGRVGVADDWQMRFVNSGGNIVAQALHGTTTANGATTLSINTTYWFWIDGSKGTGSDGVCSVYVNTSDTKPGTAEAEVTTGDSTSQPTHFLVYGVSSDSFTIDYIKVDADIIGSAP